MVRGFVVLLSVAAGLRSAVADPVRLEVDGGTCDFASLESQLTQMLGSNPVDGSAHASVHVHVVKQNKLEARVTFDDGDGGLRGPRIVTSATCSELVESVAIVIAIGLPELPRSSTPAEAPHAPVRDQPFAPAAFVASSRRVATSAPTQPASGSTADVIAVTAREAGSKRADQQRTDFFAAGAGGLRSAGVQGQLILGVRVRRGSASISAEVRADAPEEHNVDGASSISVFRTQVSVSPCLHAGSVAACAVVSAGTIHGSGIGLTSPRSVYTPLAAGGLRVTWERRLIGQVALRLHLDADALLTTTQFDVDKMKVWVSPRFEGAAGAGILARFP